jgi:membrane-bound ClpP family serine protease
MKASLGGLLVAFLLSSDVAAQTEQVFVIQVSGTINPATASYISRSIAEVSAQEAQCLILQLDTPGGLLDSTKDIVQSLYRSEVPVVVYVAPSGANATSAGCFITLASDIAAMAPHTSIGAAHPVAIGGGGVEKVDEVMKQKLENFTVSYIETIAEKRGRNVAWAKSAVRDSANITAETALASNVIEIIDRQTDPWGIKITTVEVKDVVLPETMKRAMAGQAESERQRRAKIINAEAEFQAAEKLVQAAAMIKAQPIALQLRFLQTMSEIAGENHTTTFLPLPIDLFKPFLERTEERAEMKG